MKKQTAVEWLVKQYTQGNYTWEAYQQAKEMEKEQIMEAFKQGNPTCYQDKDGRHYYNETYKKDK
jgi:hypothetical protein